MCLPARDTDAWFVAQGISAFTGSPDAAISEPLLVSGPCELSQCSSDGRLLAAATLESLTVFDLTRFVLGWCVLCLQHFHSFAGPALLPVCVSAVRVNVWPVLTCRFNACL